MFVLGKWISLLFDTDEGSGAGQPSAAADKTTGTPPVSGDNGNSGGSEPDWLPARLERAKKSEREALLKELGIADVDTLKSTIEAHRKAEEARLSESEKVAKALEAANKKAADAEAKIREFETRELTRTVDGAIRDAAKGALHPEDVVTLIRAGHADELAAAVKDGKPDEKAIGKLVDAIRKDRPTWFTGNNPGSPSNNGGKPPAADANRVKSILDGVKFPKL